jgi:hypothetical protein
LLVVAVKRKNIKPVVEYFKSSTPGRSEILGVAKKGK